ncbi:MAG: hypothetical protein CK532_03515 [Flavobacteriales bacterium]|nr:MAG: hypothetical protein CK532_03515 [Flavobacteriales bacterium]
MLQILPIVLPPLNRQLGGEPMVLAGIVERNIRGNFNISQGFMMGFRLDIHTTPWLQSYQYRKPYSE